MAEHSILSASASHRWLNCTASIKACEGLPDNTSTDAQKGTEVHELCAYKLAKKLGREVIEPQYEYSAVARTLQSNGIEPYEHIDKIKTLTAVEKELGKKRVEKLLGGLLIRVPGKENLVKVD